MKISKAGQITKHDLLKWSKNALLFAGPALIVLSGSIAEIIPKEASYGVVLLYILNLLTDYFKKWLKETRY